MQNGLSARLLLGLAQAGIAAAASIMVVLLARRRNIHVESDLLIALVRGIAQITAVGSVLVLLLRGPRWTSGLVLAAMMLAAASTSSRRAKLPGSFQVSLYAIFAGAGSVIALMTLARVIDSAITSLVPVGSMLVANAMNTNSLALNRFKADVQSHVGQIESALALGAGAEQTVIPYVEASFRASLIPAIDSLRSLGIVWIPGLMAGMILSGAPPLYSAIYQFVVLAMIFAASSLTSLISTTLIRQHAFSPADQLLLRPQP
ncbi:MAG TPA: ABC transporter permease [Clostridia bacterium]|nr:ABC transporter permease [Clostridia bacterium]